MRILETFISIVPILIIILIFRFIKGGTINRIIKSFQGKSIKLFFISYLAILLVGVLLHGFIPLEKFDSVKTNENDELLQLNIYDALCEGKMDVLNNMEIGDEFSFQYSNHTIYLSSNTDEYLGALVFIKRKSTNDNTIKVTNYLGTQIVDGMNFTKDTPSIGAEISGYNLLLQTPTLGVRVVVMGL